MKIIGVVIFVSFALFLFPDTETNQINGRILYVGGSGEGNYTSIQDAINDAMPGDTIFVYDDSSPYYESININKPIFLIGENRNTTVIDGNKSHAVINVIANGVTVKNFTIRNAKYEGIFIKSSHNNISNNKIMDSNFGIYIYYSMNNYISCNEIYSIDGWAIDIESSHNNLIAYNKIFSSHRGISLLFSNFNKIIGNVISDNELEGINIWRGNYNIISDNSLSDNEVGIYVSDSFNIVSNNSFYRNGLVTTSLWNTVINNEVNDNPLIYLEGKAFIDIYGKAGQIVLVNCRNIAIKNQNISHTSVAIELFKTSNCIISNCYFYRNLEGIFIYRGRKNEIENCTFVMNDYAITTGGSDETRICNNKFYNNQHGIWLGGKRNSIVGNIFLNHNTSIRGGISKSIIRENFIQNSSEYGIFLHTASDNCIKFNMIRNCKYAIYLTGKYSGSNRNKIIGNDFEENEYGLYIWWGENNFIHNNNFISNKLQAFDRCGNKWICYNKWDNGMDGNYWSDFDSPEEGAYDNNSDGIVDKPYNIPGGNMKDRYPLLNPWGKEIKIEICGGLGIKIIIKNVGNNSLLNLKWLAEIRGFVLPKTREGTIPIINESYELKIPVFGFGKGIVKFSLNNSFKTANLIMLGPFVFIYY